MERRRHPFRVCHMKKKNHLLDIVNFLHCGSLSVKSIQFSNKIYLTISDFHDIWHRCTIHIDLKKTPNFIKIFLLSFELQLSKFSKICQNFFFFFIIALGALLIELESWKRCPIQAFFKPFTMLYNIL